MNTMSLLEEYTNRRRLSDADARPLFAPYENIVRIEGRLSDCEYIDTPNALGQYVFSFHILEMMDHCKLENTVDELLSEWDRKKSWQIGPDEWMTATNKVYGKHGEVVCSQLFAPKLPNSPDEYFINKLPGTVVSLKLHFRDDPVGNLYCQCEYIDIYESVEPECASASDDEDDW